MQITIAPTVWFIQQLWILMFVLLIINTINLNEYETV